MKCRRHVQARTVPEQYKDLHKAAIAAGWQVVITGGNHLQWRSPCGQHTVISALSPSDVRACRNVRALLRRCGVDL